MLVSNHSGALPPDAAVIGKAIREEHAQPRPLNITVEHFFKGYPFFSMLVSKIGCVPAHPANVHRLLADEESLVLVFPEGRKGTEKVFHERYRLRRFGRGGFVAAAMRARAKIVPVCVVGAEEAAPIFAHVGPLRRLTGLLYFPLTPTFPWMGPLGMLGYLPAKFKIRFLEPIDTAELDADPAYGPRPGPERRPGGARPHPGEPARDGRQATLGVVRMSAAEKTPARRILITGLSHYWGGRLAQALEAFPDVDEEHVRQRSVIAFADQNSAPPVLDRFRNAAMLRGENGQPARHRFEHGVRNAFLVPVAATLARMQKNVRLIKQLAKLRLRNETGKENLVGHVQLRGQPPQLASQRPFARDRKRRCSMRTREPGKGAQAHPQPLLFDQAAGLEKFPGAVARPLARAKGNFVNRYAGALEPNLAGGTTDIDQSAA